MKHYNIPIFVPHKGCPFDCVFCNQSRITGSLADIDENSICDTIEAHLGTIARVDSYIEAAFFGGSFTGIEPQLQERYLGTAYGYVQSGKIDGIRISTRPDYIDAQILKRLSFFGVTTIELGVQSMDNEVLLSSNRGHTSGDVENAVALIREYSFKLGLQMMTGLPGDTPQKSLITADKIIGLNPDFVRIYPTLVVRDTELERLYKDGKYIPQSLDEAVGLCKELLLKFELAKIPVIRISLMTTDEISPGGAVVAGPFHSAFRELCEGEIYFDKMCNIFESGDTGRVFVNPKEISKAIGNKKKNLKRIKERFNIDLVICGCEALEKGEIRAAGGRNG